MHYVTARTSEANSLSRTVQLNCSWTLEMSDQHNNRFATPSECLSSYLSATSCRNSVKVNSFEMIQFLNQPLQTNNCAFDKISLLLQTILELEARSFLQTVQLDFNWNLEIFDTQKGRFARPSNSLKSFQSTICIS